MSVETMQQPTSAEIAELLGHTAWSPPVSDELVRNRRLRGVSSIDQAQPDSIVFATDAAALERALASPAGLILAAGDAAPGPRVLPVGQPRLAFAQVYARWFDRRGRRAIHPSAIIDQDAQIGENCEIGPGCVLESGVTLGAECVLGPRVVVHTGTVLGRRVRVQAGAVLGADGFGYARDASGYIGFPQIGTLTIEEDVEIGANTTIDRGALGETRIGRGTKIDNLVHIAHNCRIGQDVIIAAQAGLAGSIVVGDGAMLGGQVGLGEHVTIGPGVILGGQGGLLPGKTLEGAGKVFWGTPARPVREYLRDLARKRRGGSA
jgi:UDP-3-O-[3-hydroxymyristoyl] glucosamine N-acyltransferase